MFDVLRATTSMAAAFAAGVVQIEVCPTVGAVRSAAAGREGELLCGEEKCLRPEGFDLGNSPGVFNAPAHAGRHLCMSTTNGTKAILAARRASRILVGALVNADAVARVLSSAGAESENYARGEFVAAAGAGRKATGGADAEKSARRDCKSTAGADTDTIAVANPEPSGDGGNVILLCAGTDGAIAMEDVLGAGAVAHALRARGTSLSMTDTARMAEDLFEHHRADLGRALRETTGGRNVVAAGLDEDITFAARLDVVDVVGEVRGDPPIVFPLR